MIRGDPGVVAGLLLSMDQIKVGLTGNLTAYTFTDRNGATVIGAQVAYNGQPAGYTSSPQEAINYVDARDNDTLFDALTDKLPVATSMADRIRMQTLALSTTALIQQKLSFPGCGPSATPGVIVMRIDDTVGPNVDPALKGMVIVFNASAQATAQPVAAAAGRHFALSRIQTRGSDPVVKTSTFASWTGAFTVPARTVAVFVSR